ncbi:MAG: ABC-type transport auxiliary lipoprotein family protein [Zwartia sp.]
MQSIFSFNCVQATRVLLRGFLNASATRIAPQLKRRSGNQVVSPLTSCAAWRQYALIGMALFMVLALLTGCGVGRSGSAPQQLDLGAGYADLKASTVAAVQHPPIAMPSASAASLLSETAVIWRVGDAGQPQAYTTYQWVAPPARLVTQRLVDRLSLQGPVLQQNAVGDLPQVRLNLQRFEQTFSADGSSSVGQLTLQAILIRGTKVIDQRLVDIKMPARTQDALGGAQALREATEQAAEQVAQWLTVQLKR